MRTMYRQFAFASLIALATTLSLAAEPNNGLRAGASEPASVLVYIGTHGVGPAAAAQPTAERHGIYAARLDRQTGALSAIGLVAEIQRATWLVNHPTLPVLYSVGTATSGTGTDATLYSLALDATTGQLRELNRVGAGGADATHLDLDARSQTLLSANYGGGSVSAVPLLPDGRLGAVASVQNHAGSGPSPRQAKPHAHGVAVDPSHRFAVSADLGADKLFVYRLDAATHALSPAATPFESLPPGSGPRHLLFHPKGRYLFVVSELTAELRSYRWDAQRGRLQLLQTLSPLPNAYAGDKSASEIVLSRDGRFLYVTLRGDQDKIVVYTINVSKGTLAEIQRVACGGKTPWSMAIESSGRWMLVTNEASSSVNVFSVDPASGRLSATGSALQVPKPVTVAFYPN